MPLLIIFLLLSFEGAAKTSMDKLVKANQLGFCQQALTSIANDTIGEKKHRLMLLSSLPSRADITGIIEYKDRHSHVSYVATQVRNKCHVTFKETFNVKLPCISVREEVFKKWQLQGQLNPHTMVFQNKRKPKMRAILSGASDGSYCLVSRHTSI